MNKNIEKFSDEELAQELENWAANRDRCNIRRARHGEEALGSDPLREAAKRLRRGSSAG